MIWIPYVQLNNVNRLTLTIVHQFATLVKTSQVTVFDDKNIFDIRFEALHGGNRYRLGLR